MFGTPGTDERIDKTIDREGRAVRKEEDRPQVAQGISYPAASFGAPLGIVTGKHWSVEYISRHVTD